MTYAALAFLLGLSSGLRTFTAPATLWLMRHPGPWANVLAVLAALEYVADLHPNTPSRTTPAGTIARVVSGAFVGWVAATSLGGDPTAGALAGIAGALLGAYGGLDLRLRASAAIGNVPAGLLEDAIAIGVAVLAVMRLP